MGSRKRSTHRPAILEYLTDHPDTRFTSGEIAAIMDCSPTCARALLEGLVADMKVKRSAGRRKNAGGTLCKMFFYQIKS